MDTLAGAAAGVLETTDAQAKAKASHAAAHWWKSRSGAPVGTAVPPRRPGRPARPILKAPRDMPRRKYSGVRGRVALLHAVAHIELNAIDLAWDLVVRFPNIGWPRAFYDDWVKIGDDEARHFTMLRGRLNDLGADYGDLPAHDGLWQAAEDTRGDALARLAIVPMVLEARGLDVTPQMIARLQRAGDHTSGNILGRILEEEVGHVAAGRRWFEWLCREMKLEPATTWRRLVATNFTGNLKPPFNRAARVKAGFSERYLENL